MTVQVFRVYSDMEGKNYAFSILASAADAHYVVPEQMKEMFDIDDTRIEAMIRDAYNTGTELPEDPTGWASLAMNNMTYMTMLPTDEEYSSMAEAEEEELAYLASILGPVETKVEEEEK